jgi:hypothetical protein
MSQKEEIKIALILDDYKVPNKEHWWKKALKKAPHIERDYELVREEAGAGISKNTTNFYRFYRLKKASGV